MSKDVVAEMGEKLPGSPIVGRFNEDTQDFEAHSRDIEIKDGKIELVDITKPYGFVPTDAKVWFQYFLDDDAVTREYLCTEGYIWTKIYPETERIIKQGNNQSMELNKESVKGQWSKNDNSNSKFFIINEAIIEKLCILGENEEPCFEGAQIKTSFALKEGLEKLRAEMYSMMSQINDEGGIDQVEENKIIEENVSKDEVIADYSAEIDRLNAELEQTKTDYELLKNNSQELQEQYDELKIEVNSLREFKLSVEKKEKEDMIAGFYMLNDKDKKDVIDNIDNYSLDEIEAKLSVICVRNKVNFSLDTEEEKETHPQDFTFNLDTVVKDNDSKEDIPEWIKAVQNTACEMY